jgi:sulfate permease, SulP family
MRGFSIGRELSGAAIATLIGLSGILACALILAAPLGSAFFSLAVQSAVISAIGAAVIGPLFGGMRVHLSGPRISLSLLIAAELAHNPQLSAGQFLVLIGAATALCGVFQVLMGALRLGSLIKFLPFPVLTGFLTAVGAIVLFSQANIVFAGWVPGFDARLDLPQPMSLIALAATLAVCLSSAKMFPKVPPVLLGFAAGGVVFYLVGIALDSNWKFFNEPLSKLSLTNNALMIYGVDELPLSRQLIPHAMALAVLASLGSILSAVEVQKKSGQAFDANRELVGIGITNMLIGLAGGLPASGMSQPTEAALKAGAQTRIVGPLLGVMTLVLVTVGSRFLGFVPTAVICGALIAMSIESLTEWGVKPLRRMFGEAFGTTRQPSLWGEIATVILVMAVGITFGPSAGVGFGVVCAMVLFIMKSGQSLVRESVTLKRKRSTLQRSPFAREVLDERGDEIAFVELGGALFFGSADAFVRAATPRITRRGVLIVSVEHVTDVDSSGAVALAEVARSCRNVQCQFWLAGGGTIERHRSVLIAAGMLELVTPAQLIDTVDQALERAENHLLEEAGSQSRHVAQPLTKAAIFRGISGPDLELVRSFMVSRQLRQGESLFSKGDPVDGLYIIDSGQVGIRIEDARGVTRRIAAFTPGTMIGEIAFVEGGDRSAQAIAEEESVLWLLKREFLADIERTNPEVMRILLTNIAREIAVRLRNTTEVLRQR